jgi:hypothetical protein
MEHLELREAKATRGERRIQLRAGGAKRSARLDPCGAEIHHHAPALERNVDHDRA